MSKDMAKNNFPKTPTNFSVRPERVEGWVEKFQDGEASRSCFD
jgi:hypothetical protein